MSKLVKKFEWCDYCHHYPLDHQKGGCQCYDEWGRCNCKKFIPSEETYETEEKNGLPK